MSIIPSILWKLKCKSWHSKSREIMYSVLCFKNSEIKNGVLFPPPEEIR